MAAPTCARELIGRFASVASARALTATVATHAPRSERLAARTAA